MNANQYSKFNQLLSDYSTISAQLERAEAHIKEVQLGAAIALQPEYARLKVALTDIETEIRKISDEHNAALFEPGKRSHKTPFGEVKYHKSSHLDFDDSDEVLLRIHLAAQREVARVDGTNEAPCFTVDTLIRTAQTLNIEALENLDNATLAQFGIRRVTEDSFKVTPFALKTDKPAKVKKEDA